MREIISEEEYTHVWDKVYEHYNFEPSINTDVVPFSIETEYRVYNLEKYWEETEEKIINDIMGKLFADDIYALDWHHSCFTFSPRTEFLSRKQWFQEDSKYMHGGYMIYFPSYFPDGDYHFFISKDFSSGLLGHPWRDEMWVIGDKLIEEFEIVKDKLGVKLMQ